MSEPLDIRSPVREALARNRPVVALESTVISHGLPEPHNLQTALAMEAAIRDAGATPATIGLIDGQAVVGLTAEEIESFAASREVAKVSRRDLATILAAHKLGATTVAATIYLADRAGIRIMATGGLGGVHRGGEESLDISADLYELARTPVAVVCAGAKAILDLPRTLEVLETLGVAVVGYGTDEFPAFYSRESGLRTSHRVDTASDAASLLTAQHSLGLSSGVLFAQPPPHGSALPRESVEGWIEDAIDAARAEGVTGRAVTPYLLERVAAASAGKTLAANQELLLKNARLAATIATAMSA